MQTRVMPSAGLPSPHLLPGQDPTAGLHVAMTKLDIKGSQNPLREDAECGEASPHHGDHAGVRTQKQPQFSQSSPALQAGG